MYELVPTVLAFAIGIVVWRCEDRRTRLILGCSALTISALTATIFSGEFRESGVFFFIDLGEAALGFGIGFVAARWYGLLRGAAVHGQLSTVK